MVVVVRAHAHRSPRTVSLGWAHACWCPHGAGAVLFLCTPALSHPLLPPREELHPETPLLGQGSLPDTAVEGLLGSP